MTKMDKDGRDGSGRGTDECCLIAESMIDELHQITISERIATPRVAEGTESHSKER